MLDADECEKEMTESADEKFDGGQKIDRTPFYCPWDYLIPQAMLRCPLKGKKGREREGR